MILIVGAGGTVGQEIVRLLCQDRTPVRALLHSPQKAALFADQPVEIVPADLIQPGTLPPILAGVKKAFLLTPSNPEQVTRETNFIAAAQKASLSHVVKLSTLGANPDSSIFMCRWHGQAEKALERSSLPYTLLRCHNFMQNLLEYAATIKTEGVVRSPLGQGRVGWVDARDVAAVAAAVLTQDGHRGKIYRLTGPQALAFQDIADILSKALRRRIIYQEISEAEARSEMERRGKPAWLIDDLTQLYRLFRTNPQPKIYPTIEQITGKPARSFAQFVQDYLPSFTP